MRRPDIYTAQDVAEILNVDPAQVRHLARQHGLGFKLGRAWLFSNYDIGKLLQRPAKGRPKPDKS